MSKIHYISPKPLTYDVLEELVYGKYKIELSDEAVGLIKKCRDYLDEKMAVEHHAPIYGITTGFGSLCNRNISKEKLSLLTKNLVMSHACSTGDELQPEIIRLMLFLKAHALSLGYSGVQVETVQRILDFYNNDVLPIVYDRGSLGASGDLAPLSNLFLPLFLLDVV